MRTIHDEDPRVSYWKEWKASRDVIIADELFIQQGRRAPRLWEEQAELNYGTRR
jgi:hypothetical protein